MGHDFRAAERLAEMTPAGMKAQIDVTITDDYPLAQVIVIISALNGLIAAGLIVDYREPCIIRMAPVPLYNSFEDVFTFGKVMRKLLA